MRIKVLQNPPKRHPRKGGGPGNFYTKALGSRTLRKPKLTLRFSQSRDNGIWLAPLEAYSCSL